MSLATRCTACGTIFRVVEDQLKVSDGWVRCGRCNSVFDALEVMVDPDQLPLEVDARDSERPPGPDPEHQLPETETDAVDTRQLLLRRDEPGEADRHPQPGEAVLDASGLHDEDGSDPGSAKPAIVSSTETQSAAPESLQAAVAASAASSIWAAAVQPPARMTSPAGSTPSFLQQVERDERWHTPAMRAALIGSSVILLLMLAMQIIYHQRDAIAARSPLAADWLRSGCARWGCIIEAPRKIRDVTIVNSALSKLAGGAHTARFSLTLRNRSEEELAMPAVELSLTDFEGRLIARKALLPSDFRVDPPVVAGNGEMPLQIVVNVGEHRIAGYTVELFYP